MKLIYGRAGTGKTEYIFNDISKKINEDKVKNKIYIITPEQFSFTAEKKLIETLKEGATTNVEVLSFERMAYRVIKEVCTSNIKKLEKSSKTMIVFDAINSNAKKLKFLGKSQENAKMIITEITEFKKHNISIEMLEKQVNETKDEYLKSKLNDMLIMYKAFESKIPENFIDENDVLTLLAENIEKSKLFNDAYFYIDEFAGFTKQEYSVIEKLNRIAKELYITVCTDSIEDNYEENNYLENGLARNNYSKNSNEERAYANNNNEKHNFQKNIYADSDIFYDNKQTIKSLSKICKISEKNSIKLENTYRFKNAELKHLEQNIFSMPYKVYKEEVKNIKLYLAENQYNEIENVATQIVKLVRDEKYDYSDIAVICNNIEAYSSLFKAIFDEYNIPVFIDENKDITQNLIIKYVLAILDVFSKNFSYEAVFNYLKTGFSKVKDVYEVENYCLKWGIQGNKFYKDKWEYERSESLQNSNQEYYSQKYDNQEYYMQDGIKNSKKEYLKTANFQDDQQIIIDELFELKNKLSKTKKASETCKILYDYLISKDIAKTDEQIEALNLVIDILNEISEIFKERNMGIDEFSKILKVGLSTKELGQIPSLNNKVIVGDVNRSKTHKVKAMFIIGVNDGVFPSLNTNEGFFNDKDREKLKEMDFELAKGTKEKSYEENFNIYKAMSTAEERMYISYSSSDADGKALRKSLIISKLNRIFKNLKEENFEEKKDEILGEKITFTKLLNNIENENWKEVLVWYEKHYNAKLNSALKGLEYTNVPEKIDKSLIKKLYGNNFKTNISKLESYMACPFSYYLKYGLKLSEKEKLDIKPIDTGSFMHEVIDEFFKVLAEEHKNVKEMSDEEIEIIVEKIINGRMTKGGKFGLTAKYRNLVQRLKRVVTLSLKYIVESLRKSNFDVLGTEIKFDDTDDANYMPIEITLDDGKKVSIVGKIDRVDIAKMPDGKYIRIIDYKSSTKDIDLNKFVAGLQLQLITYVDAMCKNENVNPAGALYFTLLEPKIANTKRKDLDEARIRELIEENYKMNGLVLANVDVIRAMDNEIEQKSNKIPVTLNKSGEINYSKSKTVTREEFEKLQKYALTLIKKISKEIASGNIELRPYYSAKSKNTPCELCQYKTICQFNPKFRNNNYRYIPNDSRQDILDRI